MISSKKWQTYIQRLAEIDQKAEDLMQEWIDANGLQDNDALIEYAYALATKYGEASGELASEMYDMMAESQGAIVPPAVPADTATIDEVARDMMYGKYHSPSQISQMVGRRVRQAGADTMVQNAGRDNAEWAWVPSGDTCAFCITLASRGWQGVSKKILKGNHADHIHSNCDCTFAIAHNEKAKREYDAIYDPDKYLEMYKNADGRSPDEKINSLRRAQYWDNPEYYRAQKRGAYQARLANSDTLSARKKGEKVFITSQTADKLRVMNSKTLSEDMNQKVLETHKEILRVSKDENNSNEVAIIISKNGIQTNPILGNYNSLELEASAEAHHMLLTSPKNSLIICHNHPGGSYYSLNDLGKFIQYDSVGGITIVTNLGNEYYLYKTDSFDKDAFLDFAHELSKKRLTNDDYVDELLKKAYNFGVERGASK